MSERFDPYQAWLGVPRSSQPSYYQLLGLQNFESEPPVIAEAAEQAMAKVAAHRSGPQREAAERVLAKVKAARDVLLSSEKRAAYDQQLRSHLGVPAVPPTPSIPVSAVDSPTTMLPPGALPPLSPGGYPPATAGYDPQAYGAGQGYASGPGYGGGQAPYGAAPGYPQAPGYPPQAPGYPPQAPGYAPQAPGYPPQAPGYPPQAPSYAAMPGAPPQAGGYAPPQPAYGAPGDPYGGGAAPTAAPGGFVPFAGLSQALGEPPTASPASSPYVAPGGPTPMAPPMSAPTMGPAPGMAAPAPGPGRSADPGFSPRQSTPAMRRGSQRRQQNSTIMVALGVLGGAVALLVVAIIAANKNEDQQARNDNPAPVALQPPQSAPATPSKQPGLGISFLTPDPARVDPSFEQGSSPATGPSSMSSGGGNPPEVAMSGGPSMDNIIGKLVPDGYRPSPGQAMPTGSAPETMPAATPSATAASGTVAASMPAAMPSATGPKAGPAPKPTPVSIAGTPTGAPAMEASIPADAARAKTVQTMAKSVKASLRARDYNKAEEVALQSLVLADAPDVVAMTFEQHRATELVRALWNGTRDGVKALKPDDEIIYNGKAAKVVRHDETTLVLSQENKEVPLLIGKLVSGLVVQLAERSLPADDATTKLAAGVFLMVDAVGDKEKGRALINEAGAAGAEVEKLLAWLDMPE